MDFSLALIRRVLFIHQKEELNRITGSEKRGKRRDIQAQFKDGSRNFIKESDPIIGENLNYICLPNESPPHLSFQPGGQLQF